MASQLGETAAALGDALRHGDEGDVPTALSTVRLAARMRAVADEALLLCASRARAAGHTWQEIGDALGTSRQAAFQRFGRPVHPQRHGRDGGHTLGRRPGDQLQQQRDAVAANLFEVHAHGRQRRREVRRLRHVVETDDAEVSRDRQAGVVRRPHESQRHVVVGRETTGLAVVVRRPTAGRMCCGLAFRRSCGWMSPG
jgi:hypothetical protein